jgi:hypothetical protein
MLSRVLVTIDGVCIGNRIYLNLIRMILDRHTSYNVNDLKAPSSVINMWSNI